MPALRGRTGHALALPGRPVLGGRLHGVRDPDDRVAPPWVAGRRRRSRPPDPVGGGGGDPVPRRLLDRRPAPADPRPLARPRPPGRRVLRPQPPVALARAPAVLSATPPTGYAPREISAIPVWSSSIAVSAGCSGGCSAMMPRLRWRSFRAIRRSSRAAAFRALTTSRLRFPKLSGIVCPFPGVILPADRTDGIGQDRAAGCRTEEGTSPTGFERSTAPSTLTGPGAERAGTSPVRTRGQRRPASEAAISSRITGSSIVDGTAYSRPSAIARIVPRR